jgi:DNA-binding PadR family transcriptional regulator
VNHNRLFVLASLAAHGPLHGHAIRRQAEEDRTELWSEVRPGSLYPALHRLQAEGLIAPVRTEQTGKRPARTVYELTEEGSRELRILWEQAFEDELQPEAIDLAIYHAELFPIERVVARLEDRRAAAAASEAMLRRLRLVADPHLSVWEQAGFDHKLMRVETEISWLDRVLDTARTLQHHSRNDTDTDASSVP